MLGNLVVLSAGAVALPSSSAVASAYTWSCKNATIVSTLRRSTRTEMEWCQSVTACSAWRTSPRMSI
jgi:hypothetical protein